MYICLLVWLNVELKYVINVQADTSSQTNGEAWNHYVIIKVAAIKIKNKTILIFLLLLLWGFIKFMWSRS